MFAPYIFGAYDIDLYKGFYLEAGVRHEFVFEDLGFTLTPSADVAYVLSDGYFALTPKGRDFGLQHYDVGLIGNFSLNHFFHVDHRFGEWSVNGTLVYTARLDDRIRADTLIWGGVGLQFRY